MAVRAQKQQEFPGLLPPGTEVKGWRILSLMGQSRRGTTYLVESATAQPGEAFVLKLGRELGGEQAGRELGLLMTRVSHPHVARLRDCGRWPDPVAGQFYVVMDCVDGVPLHTWAANLNPSIGEVVDKLATVAVTLEHLHAEGILHRDLKPEHIVVRDEDGKPILIDFGEWHWPSTGEGIWVETVQGTRHLFSPEAMAFWRKHGKEVGAHYDYKPTDEVFALGVSAYRVLTGQWPVPPHLAQRNLFEVFENLPTRPPEQLNPRLPPAVCEVVRRMMAKQVQERFQSCAQAHAALVAAVSLAGPEALERRLRAPEPKPERPPVAPPEPVRPRARALRTRDMAGAMALAWFTALAALDTHSLSIPEKTTKEGPRAALAPDGTPCSSTASWNMRWYQIGTLRLRPREHGAYKGSRVIEVRDDEQVVWAMQDRWNSRVPEGTLFHGRIWVRDRLYGRFDRLVFPDGKQVPVCMEFWKSEPVSGSEDQEGGLRLVPGVALAEPSSQPGTGRVDIQEIEADVVKRWGALK